LISELTAVVIVLVKATLSALGDQQGRSRSLVRGGETGVPWLVDARGCGQCRMRPMSPPLASWIVSAFALIVG
jgi:hypothetical protein